MTGADFITLVVSAFRRTRGRPKPAETGSRLAKLFQRSAVDRRWLLRAIALHLVVACARRAVPRGPLWRHLIRGARPRATDCLGPNAEATVLWAVRTATRLVPFGRSCLTEAVTAHWLLSFAGCSSVVQIGVAAAKPVPLAHAWVECGGRTVLGGGSAVIYTPICLRGPR